MAVTSHQSYATFWGRGACQSSAAAGAPRAPTEPRSVAVAPLPLWTIVWPYRGAETHPRRRLPIDLASDRGQKWLYFLDLCVSSLRRGHANLLCIVPILTDDSRRRSDRTSAPVVYIHPTHAARTALWGREKRSISRQNTAAVVTNSITTGASAAELLRDATHDGGVPRPASRSNRCCVCVRAVRNGAHADLGDLEAREAARGTRRPACHRRLRSRARARACPSLCGGMAGTAVEVKE